MAEKEYIERKPLLENLKKQYGEDLGWQGTVNMSDVGMMIEDAPTADVVEVVRCKDCKQSEICPDTLLWCNRIEHLVPPKGFCHCGERKE